MESITPFIPLIIIIAIVVVIVRWRKSVNYLKHGGTKHLKDHGIEPVKKSKRSLLMFGLLRFIRGFCGFIFLLQIFTLWPVLTWLQQPSAITAESWAGVLFKVIILGLSAALFFGLRSLINRLHIKKYGMPHPALAEKKWAL